MPLPLRAPSPRGAARHRDGGGAGGGVDAARTRPAPVRARVVGVVAAVGLLGAAGAGAFAGLTPGAPPPGQAHAAGDVAGRSTGVGGDGDAAASAGLPAPGTAVPSSAPTDLRTIPLPQVVDRGTVGPLWLTPEDRAAGVLALGVPPTASGVLDVVPGYEPAPGTTGVRTVRVEVERDLAVDAAAFAATVMGTLNDPRGWGARGDLSFARTDGPADIRVVLASPGTTDALCAPLPTGGEVSCGRNGHAVLNARRWVLATPEFADRTLYRQYLVNHEVGHLLGHPHERCPGAGQVAPLMQQQSLAVAPCTPNGWPFP